MDHDICSTQAPAVGGMGRNDHHGGIHRRHRQTRSVDVNRLLRAHPGSDRQLVLGCTRRDSLATHGQGAVTVVIDVIDSEDARWREWKQKGRDDDARFRRRLRTVIADVAAVAAFAGALWFAFQISL